MKLTRQQVLDLLIRTKQSGHLPEDGVTSLFVHQGSGKPVQLAVTVSGEKVCVRQSRLPFSRPMVFSFSELNQNISFREENP